MFVSKINSRKVIKQREYKDDIKNTSKQAQSITTKQKKKKKTKRQLLLIIWKKNGRKNIYNKWNLLAQLMGFNRKSSSWSLWS